MGLVDCHCHLSDPDFDRVRESELGIGGGENWEASILSPTVASLSSLRREPRILF